jgi:glycerophosphoryl diester phosphodiesterase
MKLQTSVQYLLAGLAFFAGCHVSQNAQSPMQTTFDKQGHRGCRGLMPENTTRAMVHALDLGVTTLELDVVITRDKKVLVSHDPFFEADITTKPDGSYVREEEEMKLNIYQMTYQQIRSFDVGMKPHPRFPEQQKIPTYKPLLSEVFDTIQAEMMTRKRPFPQFNIEIKSRESWDGVYHPSIEEFVDLVIEIIREKGMEDFVNIQSFDFRPLRYLHQKYPAIPLAVLIDQPDPRTLDEQLTDLGFSPPIYSPSFYRVDRQLVNACHARKMRIIPWTVNKKEKIKDLKELGVDGIITDYPDLFDGL